MTTSARQVLRLDEGWRFHLGDIAPPLTNTHLAAYMLNKAGYARGAAKPSWDDSDWRVVDLPHDWAVEGEFSPDHHVDAGFLSRGVGWYRLHFALDEPDRGRHLAITFDGVATHGTVYVNGHLLHRNFCGYTPFTIDITDIARIGEDDVNTIAVRVDATYAEGWWYEGAGIYRHVWLTKSDPLHLANDSLFARPQRHADGSWDVVAEFELENTSYTDNGIDLDVTVLDSDGVAVAHDDAIVGTVVAARSTRSLHLPLPIRDPRLWSTQQPNLYTLRVTLRTIDRIVDEVTTTFGIRTIRFDPNDGFLLNDQPLKLKGTCNHQDHAGVGVAVPDSIHEFRIHRLKEMGCNAYRAAHHPPARELLNACDRLGMLVIDENRNFGSSPEHLEQLGAMVRRDRNHPCVIAWSICNEEAIQGTPVAASIARAMTAEVQKLDLSRPVMAAVSGGILNDGGLADAMPVVGINYQLPVNDQFHAKKPEIPIVAAETHCVLSTRGTYVTDPSRFVFASDDSDTAPWGATARETWRFVSTRPWLAGLFVWSGFDYRGEPTPHAWPCISSQFGVMDLCGFEKDAFFLHKAFFDPTGAAFVHILPHWNWPGEGQPIRVRAYTNCDAVELSLNGESLDRKGVDPIEMAEWTLPYRPGVVRAVGYRGDERVAEAQVETTGPAVALGLEVHPSFAAVRESASADGRFALPITVFASDARGRRVPTADQHAHFTLDGPAKIIGVGNGDPASHEPNHAMSRSLFRGLAQVIVQMTTTPGTIILTASADGLASASLTLHAIASPQLPANVPPTARKHFLADWRMSPISAARPDVRQRILAQDVNSWERIEPGKPQPQWQAGMTAGGGYAIYRATFTPPRSIQRAGGRVVFHSVAGIAEVLINDVAAATKATPAPAAVEIALPAGSSTPVTISVLVHATSTSAGLVGRVELLP